MTEKDDLGRLRDLKDTLDACHKENRSAHIMPKECKEYSDILGRRIEKTEVEFKRLELSEPHVAATFRYTFGGGWNERGKEEFKSAMRWMASFINRPVKVEMEIHENERHDD